MPAGAYLIQEGEPPENACLLLSGAGCREKTANLGSRQILAVHFQGDLLGFDCVLLQTVDYSVRSLSLSDVAFVSNQALLDLAFQYPNVGRALWRETLVEASIAREWIANVGQRDARQRISHLICEVALRQARVEQREKLTIQWPFSQEQVGDATGLTPVHVNRTIHGLMSSGLIETDLSSITILNWQALQDAGHFSPTYLNLQ
ncbi:Crp/Fnr family transcriptional regulator [Sphingomonas crusticola]|uniref:Crp/Fnr family transcriptional regulator n=1 Tax=Sphingomonas crusticola TaxID=1697973 RepID=UPI0013C30577|nr:Crp/Fnr family transcriptional regulator [Sphingomonas crusticola]